MSNTNDVDRNSAAPPCSTHLQPVIDMQRARRLLNVISALSASPHITDTLWMPVGNCTVVEALSMLAHQLGATDPDIESAAAGHIVYP